MLFEPAAVRPSLMYQICRLPLPLSCPDARKATSAVHSGYAIGEAAHRAPLVEPGVGGVRMTRSDSICGVCPSPETYHPSIDWRFVEVLSRWPKERASMTLWAEAPRINSDQAREAEVRKCDRMLKNNERLELKDRLRLLGLR